MKKVELSFITFDAQDVITTSGFYLTASFIGDYTSATTISGTSHTLKIVSDGSGKDYYVFDSAGKTGSEGAFAYTLDVTGVDSVEGKTEATLVDILGWLSSNAQ